MYKWMKEPTTYVLAAAVLFGLLVAPQGWPVYLAGVLLTIYSYVGAYRQYWKQTSCRTCQHICLKTDKFCANCGGNPLYRKAITLPCGCLKSAVSGYTGCQCKENN